MVLPPNITFINWLLVHHYRDIYVLYFYLFLFYFNGCTNFIPQKHVYKRVSFYLLYSNGIQKKDQMLFFLLWSLLNYLIFFHSVCLSLLINSEMMKIFLSIWKQISFRVFHIEIPIFFSSFTNGLRPRWRFYVPCIKSHLKLIQGWIT